MKKAVLVVSFGTTFHETREKTIDKIEEEIRANYPDYAFYRAWTSKMIIRKLMERDQIKINTVEEAMAQMEQDGITELIVQPTHILNGIENDLMTEDVNRHREHFSKIMFSAPLLTSTEDCKMVIEALMEELGPVDPQEALVFMGHGTTHHTNTVYAALDYMFKDMGYPNVFMGTVEAYPEIDSLLKLVKQSGAKKVRLAPFMIVAGDHATNDLLGEEEDSWKSIFAGQGYEVTGQLKGLGEYPRIRAIFLKHMKECLEAAK